jgi:Response regulator containing a CheY-like receiver domain and an HTH DNA-binding domain
MSSLNDLIFKLLVNNDCVILPNFGAFICQNQKAKINHENGTISPPSKRIGFNPKLTNNDGLLVSAIAKHNKSNYSEATTIVKKYVDNLSKKLNAGNRIEINKVGVFYLDKNKNIF